MTEVMSITRGRDIELYLNTEPLCGVTHLTAESRYKQRGLYEYLNAEPYAVVPDGETHEIVLTVLSLFQSAIPHSGSFTLSVVDGDTLYRYEGCTVTKHERDIRGDKAVSDRLTIAARSMTKVRNNDAG